MVGLAGVTLFRQGTGDVSDATVLAPTPADDDASTLEVGGMISAVKDAQVGVTGAVAKLKDMADENEKLKEQCKYITYDCIGLSSHIYSFVCSEVC